MKWMIRADMEGVTGVVNMKQVVPGSPDYRYGQKMLEHDLRAVLEGLLQNESDEVWIYDIHFFGTNIDVEKLDPRVRLICGKPDYSVDNRAYLDGGVDGVILLGLHSKSNTPGGLLAHNYEHDIMELKVNDLIVGEIGLEALIAGEYGVPVVLVTADSKGAEETKGLLPGTLTVSVKTSLEECAAVCLPVSRTSDLLKEAASKVPRHAPQLQPFRLAGPYSMELRFKPGELLSKLHARVPERFVSHDQMRIESGSITAAWNVYLQAKR